MYDMDRMVDNYRRLIGALARHVDVIPIDVFAKTLDYEPEGLAKDLASLAALYNNGVIDRCMLGIEAQQDESDNV